MLKERLKELRAENKLTQGAFAKKIGTSRDAYATYEYGKVIPTDVVLKVISSEFYVSEHWLRTGEGEKYIKDKEQAQLANFIAELVKNKDNKTKEIMFKLTELNEDDFNAVAHIINSLVEK